MQEDEGPSYRKVDQREHVLLRPSMYVGSTEMDASMGWVMDDATGRMVRRELCIVPALFKIFDEILMNAVDHSVRLRQSQSPGQDQVRSILVTIESETGIISVENDGAGIDVEVHSDYGVHIPELIFGHLLTSANYDDPQEGGRTIGGQNGIGAKACNIFSSWFEVETVDKKRRRVYQQMFRDNMSKVEVPVIRFSPKKPYTRVRFLPDYALFKMADGLPQDMYDLMKRRTYDITAVTAADVTVSFNGTKIDCKTFERYVDLYLGGKSDTERVYEKVNEWWEVAASVSPGSGLQHVSFVNGMATVHGGRHVDHLVTQISRRLCELISDRRKVQVKPQYIRDNLFLFVKATIPNPVFDSQTKETLVTPAGKFGVKVDLSDRFVERLYKGDIVTRAISLSSLSVGRCLTKTDGRVTGTVNGIPKLDDACWAGTKRGIDCTLVLTEGDSAKSMAIAGLAEVGRDRYGVFPLRGKLMNVCDAPAQKVADNAEIAFIKKILGLESGKVYSSRAELRYGRVMIMTDQDLDGSHIKGLLMNMFFLLWPSLLKLEGFLASMLTPIVKARKGDKSHSFYNIPDLHTWQSAGAEGAQPGWRIKWYKGLGTSTGIEAREYFKRMRIAVYTWDEEGRSADALDLAFNKRRADDRKTWLLAYDRESTLDYGRENVGFDVFVERDLVHFSNYDVERSIPSVVDGLKISQRKVMFGCFKRRLVSDEIRVAQLAGYVSEHGAYHHGETSLVGTIVNLAQTFVGSNNVNLLMPNGQFGTRLHGGKDAASARYIHTQLSEISAALFVQADEAILSHLMDDGQRVEPRTYFPILPLVLINGAVGIGTGFSTNVPSYHPMDVLRCVRLLLVSEAIDDELMPWYAGFQGTIERTSEGKVFSRGVHERIAPTKVCVSELPVGTWTQDFKEMLDRMVESKGSLKRVEGTYTDTKVGFVLTYTSEQALDELLVVTSDMEPVSNVLEASLKLVSNKGLSLSNRYLFGESGAIRKYGSTREILEDFFRVRLKAYEARRSSELARHRDVAETARCKVRFIELVASGELRLNGRCTSEIEHDLREIHRIPSVEGSYSYLLRMPVGSLTMDQKSLLETKMLNVETVLSKLEDTHARDLWAADLDAFELIYRHAHSEERVLEVLSDRALDSPPASLVVLCV